MKLFKRQHAVGICVAVATLLVFLPAHVLLPVKYQMLSMSNGLQSIAYDTQSWLYHVLDHSDDVELPFDTEAFLNLERRYQVALQNNDELRQQLEMMTELRAVIDSDLIKFMPIQARIRSYYDLSQVAQVLDINVGRAEGVLSGQAVVSGQALVGCVEWAGDHSSRVRLLTDIRFRADVYGVQSHAHGVLMGRGTQSLGLNFVSVDEGMVVGEAVISSGLDGVFPKGLLLGRIDRLDDMDQNKVLEFDISPAVKIRRLEFVTVLRATE